MWMHGWGGYFRSVYVVEDIRDSYFKNILESHPELGWNWLIPPPVTPLRKIQGL